MKNPTLLFLSAIITLTISAALPRTTTCAQDGIQCINYTFLNGEIGAVVECNNGVYKTTDICDTHSVCVDRPVPHCGVRNETAPVEATTSTSTFTTGATTSKAEDNDKLDLASRGSKPTLVLCSATSLRGTCAMWSGENCMNADEVKFTIRSLSVERRFQCIFYGEQNCGTNAGSPHYEGNNADRKQVDDVGYGVASFKCKDAPY
ncbi:hypothetical protein EJ02DRAFT_207931 [Clathrospora elynae]|uniref:Uncharacterized protein n=1 Tax=Clathrospora elynae TaxID=706981 RepID=A0A6A5SN90_9PLEO|nr:hypothetical protein EJ02DRAFT_207931 [Clathrospora elynae]